MAGYGIMQEYRRESCLYFFTVLRRQHVSLSSVRSSRAETIPRLRGKMISAVFSAHHALYPSSLKDVSRQGFISVQYFVRKPFDGVSSLIRAAMGFYRCMLFSESMALYDGNISIT